VRRGPTVQVSGIEECENYWHLDTQKLLLTKKQVLKNYIKAACVSNHTIGKII